MTEPADFARDLVRWSDAISQITKPMQDAMAKLGEDTVARVRFTVPAEIINARLLENQAISQLAEKVTELGRQLMAQVKIDIDPAKVEAWWRRGLPPNWQEMQPTDDVVDQLVDLMQRTGWCLVWVPRWEIVEQVHGATDDEAAEAALVGSAGVILEDAALVLEDVSRAETADDKAALLKAIEAYADGYTEAAQTLASAVISSLIGVTYGMKFGRARREFGRDVMTQPWIDFRRWAILSLVTLSLQQYYPEDGDSVPATFSRHASAHSTSPIQLTRANGLAAILLATAFLRETEEILIANDEKGDGQERAE